MEDSPTAPARAGRACIIAAAMMRRRRVLPAGLLLGLLLAAACAPAGWPLAAPTASPSPPPPTPTPRPAAALVNGEAILLEDFESEWERAQAASGTDLASSGPERMQILQALIDRLLLAQGARALGQTVGPEDLARTLEDLAAARGSPEAVGGWLAAQGYSVESFERALELDLLAAQMVAEIAAGLPEAVEQVHARHILLPSQSQAEAVLAELRGGADFAALAARSLDLSTRPAGGDLGWFARGTLQVLAVEQTAFSLEPGGPAEIVQSDLGYHVVQTLARELRPPAAQARLRLQAQLVERWLEAQRAAARIEILLPADAATGE